MKHVDLAKGKWNTFTLSEQLGNIGSEVNRAVRFKNKDNKAFDNAFERALELIDLTIADTRWLKRLKEITRARELLCAALYENNEYQISLEMLNEYFYHFALAARLSR